MAWACGAANWLCRGPCFLTAYTFVSDHFASVRSPTACYLAYFGFLRSAEFAVPRLSSLLLDIHLGVLDIAFDSAVAPICLRVRIKGSKTDPFRKGCSIHIGRGKYPLCAIQALADYLAIRGNAEEPLFLFRYGHPFSPILIRGNPRQRFQPQLDW